MIILGDGGHRGTGYVTRVSAVQLVSKLWKLFDLMTSRWPIIFTKSAPSFEKLTGSAPLKDGLGIVTDWSLWISHFSILGY